MIRKLLLLLALLVLIAIALVYMGIIHWPGGRAVEVRPVDVKMERRQVELPVPVVAPSGTQNTAQSAPPPPAGQQPAPPPQQ